MRNRPHIICDIYEYNLRKLQIFIKIYSNLYFIRFSVTHLINQNSYLNIKKSPQQKNKLLGIQPTDNKQSLKM